MKVIHHYTFFIKRTKLHYFFSNTKFGLALTSFFTFFNLSVELNRRFRIFERK